MQNPSLNYRSDGRGSVRTALVLVLLFLGLVPHAAAQTALITFDDVPAGTIVDTTYRPLGVVFGCIKGKGAVGSCSNSVAADVPPNYNGGPPYSGPNVITVVAGNKSHHPAFNEYNGYATAHFLSPVSMVSIYAKAIKQSAASSRNRPYLQAFDANNKWLATVDYPETNDANWGTWQQLVISRPSKDIQYVVFSSTHAAGGSNVAVYGVFDNLSFSPQPLPQWLSITAGNGFSGAIKTDGSLWTWGKNIHGQLGNGTTIKSDRPLKLGANQWTSMSAGGEHLAAIQQDGTLWSWGWNSTGQLGDGSTVDRSMPARVGAFTDWAAIASGYDHTLGMRSDKNQYPPRSNLWLWGSNASGQLGDGSTTPRSVPGQLPDWFAIKNMAAGEGFSLVTFEQGSPPRTSSPSVYGWGENSYGQLGVGTTARATSPLKIRDGLFTQMSAGSAHMAAILGGELSTWGLNSFGQLGHGTTSNLLTPMKLPGTWSAVAAGGQHTLGIKADGTLWAWGWNAFGQLGNGTTLSQFTPVQIGTDSNWTAVAAGFSHSLGVKADGSLWAWGRNDFGQLGDHTEINKTLPTRSGQLMVNALGGSRGKIIPSAAQSVDYMAVVPFTVTPDPGYTASVSGCGGTLQGTVYKTAPINGDCTVIAKFDGPRPNLVVAAFTIPATATGGQGLSIRHTIKNSGTLGADASTACIYYKNTLWISRRESLLTCKAVRALAVGESVTSRYTATLPTGLPKGSYNVYLRVDSTGVVDESVETDNTATRTIAISP